MNIEAALAAGQEAEDNLHASDLSSALNGAFNSIHDCGNRIRVQKRRPKRLKANCAFGAASVARGGDTIESDGLRLATIFGTWTEIEVAPEAQPFFGMEEYGVVPQSGASVERYTKALLAD